MAPRRAEGGARRLAKGAELEDVAEMNYSTLVNSKT